MPCYRYKAVDASGHLHQGQMEESSADAVIRQLQATGHIPIQADEVRAGLSFAGIRLGSVLRRRRVVGHRDVSAFTQAMASMLGAGIPLDRAFDIMLQIEDEPRLRSLIGDLQQAIREGASFSTALEQQQGMFSKFYISLIRTAEAGGELERGLSRLLDYLENRKQLQDRITSALIYPIILLIVTALSLLLILTYVVPQFEPMFEDLGSALPAATRFVLFVADGLTRYGWVLIILAAGAAIYIRHCLSSPARRKRLDALALRTPLVGPLIEKIETARLSRSLGTLLDSGVPVLSSLSIANETLSNQVMVEAMEEAVNKLKQGDRLADSLLEAGRFPKLALQMIKVGEETGNLGRMLLKIADLYDREIAVAVQRLLAILEPAMIVGLGALIAGIIMSILVGIVSVNELPL